MANVTELSQFDSGIYQLETTDPVEGGASGVSNFQAKGLANRTRWLKDQIFPGELKWLNVDASFVSTNFPSGLGVGIYTGWAVANGTNGTEDMTGLVAIGQGGSYPIGSTGGSADTTLPAHTHTTALPSNTGGVAGSGGITYNGANNNTVTVTTSSAGSSATGKNMQPYRSVLCIQKI